MGLCRSRCSFIGRNILLHISPTVYMLREMRQIERCNGDTDDETGKTRPFI